MKTSIMIFLIISVGILIYSNSLGNDFIWDDTGFIIKNDYIKDLRLYQTYFISKEPLAQGGLSEENYRPFLPLSLAIDYYFWKLNPLGYHLTNLLFHILNALALFGLIYIITRSRYIAFLASIFFLRILKFPGLGSNAKTLPSFRTIFAPISV